VDHLVGERIARDDLLGVPRAIGRGRDRAQHDGAAIDAMAIVIAIQDDAYAGEREIEGIAHRVLDEDRRETLLERLRRDTPAQALLIAAAFAICRWRAPVGAVRI
jgi:hypothetical protein